MKNLRRLPEIVRLAIVRAIVLASLALSGCKPTSQTMNSREIYESEPIPGAVKALNIDLPVEPYGSARLSIWDDTQEAKDSLVEISSNWEALWPSLRQQLEDGIKDYETGQKMENFSIEVELIEPEDGDDLGDYHSLSFEFEQENPVWNAFVKGATVGDFQPIF